MAEQPPCPFCLLHHDEAVPCAVVEDAHRYTPSGRRVRIVHEPTLADVLGAFQYNLKPVSRRLYPVTAPLFNAAPRQTREST